MGGYDQYKAGRECAEQWLVGADQSTKQILRALERDAKRIRLELRRLEKQSETSPADRWLRENQYLTLLAALSVREGLKGVSRLPGLEQPRREVRVAALARDLTARPGPLSGEELAAFLEGVQSVCPLWGAELRALLPALRFAVLEQLSAAVDEPDERRREETFSHLFTVLRQWNDLDFQALTERASLIHAAFLGDPTGDYPNMASGDRAEYRRRLERLAKRQGRDEEDLARELVEQSGGEHIGFALFRPRMGAEQWASRLYFPLIAVVSLALAVYLGLLAGAAWSFPLLWFPVLQILRTAVDAVILRLLPPRPVFRMALPGGLPEQARTLMVKTTLLTGEGNLEEVRHLEQLYLANRDCGDALSVGLLADLGEREGPMGREERDRLRRVEQALDELNSRYQGRFFLFFRTPVYQPANEKYAGWERKRGALLELGRLLRGRSSSVEVYSGDRTRLNRIKYLVTLDSDTGTGVGGVRALAGAMLHPLNRPVLDEKRRVVVSGYGIMQPQIRTELSSAHANAFARLFSGSGGSDPYRGMSSELCHDLFDESSFSGKGVIDVDCFLACLDGRFPDQRVLSHDILEGAYLRCGYLSRVSFSDRFPSCVGAYYQRQHRWVRGDWQNLPWLFRRAPEREVRRAENPISAVSRWKLADNLRRSLTPIAQLACLLLGVVPGGRFSWLLWAAVASLAVDSVLSFFRRGLVRQALRRFHSKVLPELGQILLATAVRLVLLPLEAWTNLRAIVTALWRSLVSHRNMLQWTTSAAQSARKNAPLPTAGASVVTGVVLGLFARQPLSLLLAVLWVLSPLVVWALEQRRAAPRLRAGERAFLYHEAEQIWGYFADFLTAGRNFLPPDNFQLRPYRGAAERTSPTNIGFAALSCLAAIDLELEPREQALKRLGGMLDTLGRLEKWRGNLYNWYNTLTCAPMEPKVVSSVDSGNLCASLFALGMGLRELGEEALAATALRLAEETQLEALYDRDKHLFYISYEPDTGVYSKAHYDLMASEARLLSYVALAEGRVDRRHWRALSRVQMASHHYQGMASWSGTMFEFFMPHLLLPLPPDSFLYESLAFCACEQLRYGREKGAPWGVSESAVPELDQNGCYGYRANGVPALALSGAPEKGYVAAPYATYLTLPILPHLAVANLRRLHGDGLEGKYGLYEAAEYRDGAVLPAKSWMAHHMGMSLLAIDNALRDQIQIKRFLARPSMSAYVSLLEETVPRHARHIDLKRLRPAPVREGRDGGGWRVSGEGYSQAEPVCALLAGQAMSALVCNNGGGWMMAEEVSLVDRRHANAFYLLRDGVVTRLFPCSEGADVRWELEEERCRFELALEDCSAALEIALRPGGEIGWTLRLSRPEGELDGVLLFSCKPQLASQREYLAHPAFRDLTVESRAGGRSVLFHRRSPAPAYPDLRCRWPEDNILCRTGSEALRRQLELGLPGFEPGLLLELPVRLEAGKQASLQLTFDVGETPARQRPERKAVPEQVRELASRLLPELVFAPQLGREGSPGPQRLLWRYGVSGDDPILCAQAPGEEKEWEAILAARRCLTGGGVRFDLVFLAREKALLERIRGWMGERGLRPGGHCGVHLVPENRESGELFRGMCCARLENLPERRTEFPRLGTVERWKTPGAGGFQYAWGEDVFQLQCHGNLPAARWSIPLTNGSFGYLATETGGGYLWSGNARLFKLTPWANDPCALDGPERLELWDGPERLSLFAARDGRPCGVTFGPGFLRWEKRLGYGISSTLTAFVPQGRNERVFLLKFDHVPPGASLVWRLRPQMGEYGSQGLWCRAWEEEHAVYLKNPVAEKSGVRLTASRPWCSVSLPEGRSREVVLTFPAPEELVLQIGEECPPLTPEQAGALLGETAEYWRQSCGYLRVETPDEALNHYLSFWCQYQIQASRLLARTSVYQCGGAYGFRDQLQDCCALIQNQPEQVRQHILRCCRHQFPEGDVLHWWHEIPGGGPDAGVRTHVTDDLLWLPYAVSVWQEEMGDLTLLEESVPYLAGERLRPEERDRYFAPEESGEADSVCGHCVRAIECVLGRGVGEHGLCKIGGGDWNDGMDRAGGENGGESVWLTWFAALVLERFARVLEELGERERSLRYSELSRRLTQAAEQSWDGAWFLRGYFGSGGPLGGRNCPECQIDSIAQSFAALQSGDRERTLRALESAQALLLHEEAQALGLLYPPFDFRGEYPGYIAAYRPGARENGGQYTHAAVWLARAWFHLGRAGEGFRLLRLLLPEHHPVQRYQGEPFVLAGDVSLEPGKEGAAGWTWYTGAAGWYFRTAVQDLLGIRFRKGLLYLEPQLPEDWEGCRARLCLGACRLSIEVARGAVESLSLDGKPAAQGLDCSSLTGEHLLRLEIFRKIGCGQGENRV